MKEEEEEERAESIVEALEGVVEATRPVACKRAKRAMKDFGREYYESLRKERGEGLGLARERGDCLASGGGDGYRVMMNANERRTIAMPNLEVPDENGLSYVTLAQ